MNLGVVVEKSSSHHLRTLTVATLEEHPEHLLLSQTHDLPNDLLLFYFILILQRRRAITTGKRLRVLFSLAVELVVNQFDCTDHLLSKSFLLL